eukprot:scaffold164026_cov31-Tisochrysis_lutea.AAC.1
MNYVEIDIFVDRFGYVAQRGLHVVKQKIKEADLHVAFLLQGTSDDELPEQVCACARIPFLDWEKLPQLPRLLAERQL